MSGGMPELGSKISLISKADIRYEGRLFTVDPTECTIALANVRSFGTEDRETQYPIAPQSQIYDYILFRGSDIKDIRVVNNGMPHPNDPAIMQMQLPNGQHLMPHFTMPAMNPPMGGYGNPFGTMSNLGGLGSSGLAPGSFMLGGAAGAGQKPKQQSELNDAISDPTTTSTTISAPQNVLNTTVEHKDQVSVLDLLTGASRSTTPVSLVSRKSPSADMAVQVNQNLVGGGGGGGMHRGDMGAGGHKRQNQQQRMGNQQQRIGGGGGVDGNRIRRDSGKMNNQAQQDNRNHQRNIQNNQNNRGWINRNNTNTRGNRGGRGRMQNQIGGYRQQGIPNKGTRPNKNTIKFEQDYDFEQANNQFEELRSQLSKLKVGEDAKPEQINGEVDKKDDSGNETGAGEHEQEEEEIVVGYDKTKSFFDNISCEAATDRSKGKSRNDWRQERKLNSETFGISSTRRNNYRGRGGGYYNRNMNSHGGYNRGYNRGGNFRGRNNNANNRNGQQNTGLPNKTTQNQIQQSQQNQQQPQPQQQNQTQGQQQQSTALVAATGK